MRKRTKLVVNLMVFSLYLGSSTLAIPHLDCRLTELFNGPLFPGNSTDLSLRCVHGTLSRHTAQNLSVMVFLPRLLIYKTHVSLTSTKSPSNFVNSTSLVIEYQSLEVSEKIDLNITVDVDPFHVSTPGYLHKLAFPFEVSYSNSSTCAVKNKFVGQTRLKIYSPECSGFSALGMESGAIKESQLTATSVKVENNGHTLSPNFGRLKHNNYWSVATHHTSVKNNFIQINFRKIVRIEEIVTQGSTSNHVSRYRIEHSPDGVVWTDYREDGVAKIFKANSATDIIAEEALSFPLQTRYLRIFPIKWQKEIRLKVEFYGCVIKDSFQEDDQPLGMEFGQILSSEVTSSSNLAGTLATKGRLNQPGLGWCAATQDELQYLQIDLLKNHVIKAVSVQSSGCTSDTLCVLNTVNSFYLSSSTDGTSWDTYIENGQDKLFLGALVQSIAIKHNLIQPITTRFVRFKPKTFTVKICMRTEIHGQDVTKVTETDQLPIFARSFLLIPSDNTLVMCNAERSNLLIQGNINKRCYLTKGSSKQWTGFPFRVRSLLGYDIVNDIVYAVGMKANVIVQVGNIRSTSLNFKASVVQRSTWENIKALDTILWATEVPFIPITGQSSTDEPSQSLLKQATNGDTWGASSQGIHYKPSGVSSFTLVALWHSQEFDSCISSPCFNDGSCAYNASSRTHSCLCKRGWGGMNCNTTIKECEWSPCQNNGTCINTVNGFSCNCTDDWTGDICTIYQNPAWFCEGTWNQITSKCDCHYKDDWGRHCEYAAIYRLVNGAISREGRVEVLYNNQWGTLCDNGWSLNGANVLCKFLGYPGAKAFYTKAHFGQGTGPVILDDVVCQGNEKRLGLCAMTDLMNSNCLHSQDAGVECKPRYRLAGGSKVNEGRVEVFYNESWGTVCDRDWNADAGLVACKSLGYDSLQSSFLGGNFPQGSDIGQVILDNVSCIGNEAELHLCQHDGWGKTSCGHERDVGVKCKVKIRLVGGATAKEGRVEIMVENKWGTVCDDHWTITEGNVVCRSLGYARASSVTTQASFGPGTGPTWLDNVYCSGSETSIEECKHNGWGIENCGHSEDSGVVCA